MASQITVKELEKDYWVLLTGDMKENLQQRDDIRGDINYVMRMLRNAENFENPGISIKRAIFAAYRLGKGSVAVGQ